MLIYKDDNSTLTQDEFDTLMDEHRLLTADNERLRANASCRDDHIRQNFGLLILATITGAMLTFFVLGVANIRPGFIGSMLARCVSS